MFSYTFPPHSPFPIFASSLHWKGKWTSWDWKPAKSSGTSHLQELVLEHSRKNLQKMWAILTQFVIWKSGVRSAVLWKGFCLQNSVCLTSTITTQKWLKIMSNFKHHDLYFLSRLVRVWFSLWTSYWENFSACFMLFLLRFPLIPNKRNYSLKPFWPDQQKKVTVIM